MLNTLLWGLTCSAQHNRHAPWSFDRQPQVRGQPVSATPHDSRPVKYYVTCTGAPATDVASIGAATCLLFRPNRFTPRSADPGNMIWLPERVYKHAERWDNYVYYYIYDFTARCVHIELCSYFIYSATWRTYSCPLLIPPSSSATRIIRRHFHCNTFSNTNYLSPAATRLTQPIVRVRWRIFPSSPKR